MTCFELNEKLKEALCLKYGAFFAKTLWLPNGCIPMPEPFYETTVLWEKETEFDEIKKCRRTINTYRKKIDKVGHMTEVVFEYNTGHPALVYGVFLTPYKD